MQEGLKAFLHPRPSVPSSVGITSAGAAIVGLTRQRRWNRSVADARNLTEGQFQGLADVPPELEWLGNLEHENTRQAYQRDVAAFARLAGLQRPAELRRVTRSRVIAWRRALERRRLAPWTMRRKLSALTSLCAYLCEQQAMTQNPAQGVQRPKVTMLERRTLALSTEQARALLEAPPAETLKGKRDRAMLATLLYHGIRREELCKFTVRDLQRRDGLLHLRIEATGTRSAMCRSRSRHNG